MAQHYTHLPIFYGQANQFEVGTALPTTREEAMYIQGNQSGLDNGDVYIISTTQTMNIRIGGSWVILQLQTAP